MNLRERLQEVTVWDILGTLSFIAFFAFTFLSNNMNAVEVLGFAFAMLTLPALVFAPEHLPRDPDHPRDLQRRIARSLTRSCVTGEERRWQLFGRGVRLVWALWLSIAWLPKSLVPWAPMSLWRPSPGGAALFVLGMGVAATLTLVVHRRLDRARELGWRRLRQINYRLCPGCGYDLASHTGPVCPECGRPCDETSTRARWDAIYDHRFNRPWYLGI